MPATPPDAQCAPLRGRGPTAAGFPGHAVTRQATSSDLAFARPPSPPRGRHSAGNRLRGVQRSVGRGTLAPPLPCDISRSRVATQTSGAARVPRPTKCGRQPAPPLGFPLEGACRRSPPPCLSARALVRLLALQAFCAPHVRFALAWPHAQNHAMLAAKRTDEVDTGSKDFPAKPRRPLHFTNSPHPTKGPPPCSSCS